jgi:energy-converting hydrogenase Eha subunit C
MSTAEATRDAVRRRPFLLHALRAGVLNYTAAAAFLDVQGEDDAVATALRRFAEELPAFETGSRDARVTMQSGVGVERADEAEGEPLLRAGGSAVVEGGSLTAVLATGEVDAAALGAVCSRVAAEGVTLHAAGTAGESLVVVVGRRDGPTAVQLVESVLDAVPS